MASRRPPGSSASRLLVTDENTLHLYSCATSVTCVLGVARRAVVGVKQMWDEVGAPHRSLSTPSPPRKRRALESSDARKSSASSRKSSSRWDDDDFDVDVDDEDARVAELDDDDETKRRSKAKAARAMRTPRVHSVQVDFGTQFAEAEAQPEGDGNVRVAVKGNEVMQSFAGTERCACCRFELGKPPRPDLNPLHAKVHAFYEEYRCWMNMPELCSELVKFYDEVVRKPLEDDGVQMPTWTERMVEQHLTAHITDAAHAIEMMLREVRMTRFKIQDKVFSRRETGDVDVDPEMTKMLLACGKRESELLREKERLRDTSR